MRLPPSLERVMPRRLIDQDVEELARRVAARLLPAPMAGLLSAAQVAGRFGVRREWVYAHASELGAVRIGTGPRPRIRFDPAVVERYLLQRAGPPPAAGRPAISSRTVPLLPVKGSGRRRLRAVSREGEPGQSAG